MKEIVRLNGIEKKYGERTIISNLDLVVNKGEFISITGKSGEGKTTLLNLIGLLDSFQNGNYLFEGNDVSRSLGRKTEIRSKSIGFIFQDYCLLENLSVLDNILMPFFYSDVEITKKLYAKANEYLEKFGLTRLGKTKAKFLSGGEKQRVSIVRAMLKEPSLILADEPTGNLDPENSQLISSELKKLSQMGTAVIVVTHNQNVFENVDTKYKLSGGRVYYE